MASGKKVYVDLMSQPARALLIFCRSADVQVETVITNIVKGEHRKPEYKAINPLGKIPCYAEPGFSLGETATIMRYLASTNNVEDHWYPADPRRRARVDSAMDWHHGNVRSGCATLMVHRVFASRIGKVKDVKAGDQAEELLISSLKMLQRFWLGSTSFVAGDEISIADLLICTELDMLHMLAGATEGRSRAELLDPFSNVTAWMQRVADTCAPHHEEVSAMLMKNAARAGARNKTRPGQSKL